MKNNGKKGKVRSNKSERGIEGAKLAKLHYKVAMT